MHFFRFSLTFIEKSWEMKKILKKVYFLGVLIAKRYRIRVKDILFVSLTL